MKLRSKIKEIGKKILNANATPHEIAMGCGMGLFTAMVPIVPVQTLLLLLLFVVIRKTNKPAAYAISWVMNQFTILPIYAFEFWLGSLFLGRSKAFSMDMVTGLVHDPSLGKIVHAGGEVLLPLVTGGLVSAAVLGTAGYFSVYFLLKRRQRRRAQKGIQP